MSSSQASGLRGIALEEAALEDVALDVVCEPPQPHSANITTSAASTAS